MTQPARSKVADAGETQSGDKPVDKIRIGSITASIWNNRSEKGDIFSVTFERHFRIEGSTRKTIRGYRRDDLLELAKAAILLDGILESRQRSGLVRPDKQGRG
jgi:hypothetical protein